MFRHRLGFDDFCGIYAKHYSSPDSGKKSAYNNYITGKMENIEKPYGSPRFYNFIKELKEAEDDLNKYELIKEALSL